MDDSSRAIGMPPRGTAMDHVSVLSLVRESKHLLCVLRPRDSPDRPLAGNVRSASTAGIAHQLPRQCQNALDEHPLAPCEPAHLQACIEILTPLRSPLGGEGKRDPSPQGESRRAPGRVSSTAILSAPASQRLHRPLHHDWSESMLTIRPPAGRCTTHPPAYRRSCATAR